MLFTIPAIEYYSSRDSLLQLAKYSAILASVASSLKKSGYYRVF